MMRQSLVIALTVLAVPFVLPACEPGGVGDPCIPNGEFSQDDPGSQASEVKIEDRSFQCETRVCISKNFQGRVSCPFGNKAGGSTYSANGDGECYVPGTNIKVNAAVTPQCSERVGQVYCTCRCDGNDSNAFYCECPDGYECREPSTSFDEAVSKAGDKYCIKKSDTATTGHTCKSGNCDTAPDKCGFSTNSYPL